MRHLSIKNFLSIFTVAALALGASSGYAHKLQPSLPIIIIGASIGSGETPVDEFGNGTLDGLAVANGAYLDLGDVLTQELREGFVINEAVGGATTYARLDWISYLQQLEIAFKRVLIRPTTELNAEYVVITLGNDCLHALAPDPTTGGYCDQAAMEAVADRLEEVVQATLARGLTPVMMGYPPYANSRGRGGLDMQVFQTVNGLPWVIEKQDYLALAAVVQQRFSGREDVIYADVWNRKFSHIGDGIHPDSATMRSAARSLIRLLK